MFTHAHIGLPLLSLSTVLLLNAKSDFIADEKEHTVATLVAHMKRQRVEKAVATAREGGGSDAHPVPTKTRSSLAGVDLPDVLDIDSEGNYVVICPDDELEAELHEFATVVFYACVDKAIREYLFKGDPFTGESKENDEDEASGKDKEDIYVRKLVRRCLLVEVGVTLK